MRARAIRIPAVQLLGALALSQAAPALGQAISAPATEDAVPDGLSNGDWAGIRAAYEAGRHATYSVEDGYEARNPGQG